MRSFRKLLLPVYTALYLLMMAPVSFSQDLEPGDVAYLKQLAVDTWAYLENHLSPGSGLPTDSQTGGGKTNTTNIGLYLASIGPAVEMGFIPKERGLAEARKIIASVKELPSKYGFIPNWVPVEGKEAIGPGVMAVSDFNKLPAGLILIRQYFPELSEEVKPLLDRIEWQKLYDAEKKSAHYGYDLLADKPVGDGTLWLAGDVRLAAFFMIASGAAEPEFWARLDRPKISAYGLEFFGPGYEWGGIFMQGMDGIFMGDRGTDMGKSIADFAWHQMRLAKTRNYPVWGWASCNIPQRGYTEGGFIPEWVIAPYASALVIEYYPHRVLGNFRNLEMLGAREPLLEEKTYGFRDSFDLMNQIADKRYLALDQAMIFLPLANFLQNQTVRRHFAQDPFVAEGLKKIEPYFKSDPAAGPDPRDNQSPEPFPATTPSEIVYDFLDPKAQAQVQLETEGTGFADPKFTPQGLKIEFDLGNKAAGEADVVLTLPPFDATNLSEVVIRMAGKRTDDRGAFGSVRIHLKDDQGQGEYAAVPGMREEMKDFTLPKKNRYGIFANPSKVGTFRFKLWGKPWFYTMHRTAAATGEITVEKITFKFGPAPTSAQS